MWCWLAASALPLALAVARALDLVLAGGVCSAVGSGGRACAGSGFGWRRLHGAALAVARAPGFDWWCLLCFWLAASALVPAVALLWLWF